MVEAKEAEVVILEGFMMLRTDNCIGFDAGPSEIYHQVVGAQPLSMYHQYGALYWHKNYQRYQVWDKPYKDLEENCQRAFMFDPQNVEEYLQLMKLLGQMSSGCTYVRVQRPDDRECIIECNMKARAMVFKGELQLKTDDTPVMTLVVIHYMQQ